MSRKPIEENVKRRLFAESMGRCMNPNCRKELFESCGDIIEKAHIDPYSDTEDNSFENLVLLCPNCHTNFDKNHAFSPDEVRKWKKIRQHELDTFFSEKLESFEQLCEKIVPLLTENKMIYEKYYLGNRRSLWDRFELIILVNNSKIKRLLENNMNLIQVNKGTDYESNQDYVNRLLLHINEFEKTRDDEEKIRGALFPKEIYSIFGIEPIHNGIVTMTEALESLISKVDCKEIVLGVAHPYIIIHFNNQDECVYLDDSPRLMQLYYSYECFRKVGIRLESLNFALKYLKDRGIKYTFRDKQNIHEIDCLGHHIIYVYKYCLSRNDLERLLPGKDTVIVNLHNWNGEKCISHEAYIFAETIDVTLLTMDAYYDFIKNKRKNKRTQ